MFGEILLLLLIKVWCLAKEVKAAGGDLEVSFAEVVESVCELKKC